MLFRLRALPFCVALLGSALGFPAYALAVREAYVSVLQDGRTVFKLLCDQATTPKIFHLKNPPRIVLDFQSLAWHAPALNSFAGKGGIAGLRMGQFTADTTRLVIQTNRPVKNFRFQKLTPASFQLAFNSGAGPVPLLTTKKPHLPVQPLESPAANPVPAPPPEVPPPTPTAKNTPSRKMARFTIVLDAGHGGNDPGAVALKTGVREKLITLNFAKMLKNAIEQDPRFRVILTRDSDVYIPLVKRVAIARENQASLFISLHADMFPSAPHIRGATVYTLSDTASDEEAAALAQSENKSDLIGGVTLPDESLDVAGILLDLAQRETHAYSLQYAAHLVDHMKRTAYLTPHPHREAGFRVLKAPDVPSVLIEMGYLSNETDQLNLLDAGWKKRLAGSIATSIHQFFVK